MFKQLAIAAALLAVTTTGSLACMPGQTWQECRDATDPYAADRERDEQRSREDFDRLMGQFYGDYVMHPPVYGTSPQLYR